MQLRHSPVLDIKQQLKQQQAQQDRLIAQSAQLSDEVAELSTLLELKTEQLLRLSAQIEQGQQSINHLSAEL